MIKLEFLHKEPDSRRLIIIFSGWSADASIYHPDPRRNWDIAVAYMDFTTDEDTLQNDLNTILEPYSTVYLYAWSLGVRVAEAVLPKNKITAAFAINGTLNLVDDREGIPGTVYRGTEENLDLRNLKKFRRRMSPDSQTFARLFDRDFSDNEIGNLRRQLRDIAALGKAEPSLPWRKAFISSDDRIFPPVNMQKGWGDAQVEIQSVKGAHYVPIESIISTTLPDPSVIGTNFQKASETYDDNAIAQKLIIERLMKESEKLDIRPHGKILEIGPGTGLLTSSYSEKIRPASITYVDIASECGPYAKANEEEFYCCDAEEWMQTHDDRFDYIFSSSTIQWFADIEEFLRQCAVHLLPHGAICLSGFVKGNLAELDALRPAPLLYPTETAYRRWTERYFRNVRVLTDDISVTFDSARDLLMHLRLTGVNGSAPSAGIPMSSLRNLRTLTYRPVYILASEPRL